jgi:hypothetical protein
MLLEQIMNYVATDHSLLWDHTAPKQGVYSMHYMLRV